MRNQKPEAKFRCGAISVSIFANEIDREGVKVPIKKGVFQKRYKDKDDQWKTTNSLDTNDIPKALFALAKAYDYMISADTTQNSDDDEPQRY